MDAGEFVDDVKEEMDDDVQEIYDDDDEQIEDAEEEIEGYAENEEDEERHINEDTDNQHAIQDKKIPKRKKRSMETTEELEEKQKIQEERQKLIEDTKGRTVYVGNLKRGTTVDEMRQHFEECGEIFNVTVVPGRKPFGFVAFEDSEAMIRALRLNNSVLNGLPIIVLLKRQDFEKSCEKDPARTIKVMNKQKLDTVELKKLQKIFGEFGEVDIIKVVCTKVILAFVTYKQAEDAQKARELNGTTVDGLEIEIEEYKPYDQINNSNKLTELNKERSISVRNLKGGTTEEQLREHFRECGTIETVSVMTGRRPLAYVCFKEKEAAIEALKLHNTVLNGFSIGVFRDGDKNDNTYDKDPARTIKIKNPDKLETVDVEKLNEIFRQCGEVETIEILCMPGVLAFATFRSEDAAKKALQLSGTKVDDLKLEILPYELINKNRSTTVFVQNIKKTVLEEDIRQHFAECGEIDKVTIKPGYALVRFVNSEGFNKAFTLNDSILGGQNISMKPYYKKIPSFLRNVEEHGPPKVRTKSSYRGSFSKRGASFNRGPPSNRGGGGFASNRSGGSKLSHYPSDNFYRANNPKRFRPY